MVPEDDYRQWLRSVVRAAFQLRNDQANLIELPADSSKQITTKDTMLAWAIPSHLNIKPVSDAKANFYPSLQVAD